MMLHQTAKMMHSKLQEPIGLPDPTRRLLGRGLLLFTLLAAAIGWMVMRARIEAQEWQLSAFAETADAIFVCDASARILLCNHAAEKLTGFTSAELQKGGIGMLLGNSGAYTLHQDAWQKRMTELASFGNQAYSEKTLRCTIRHRDGTPIRVDVAVKMTYYPRTKSFIAIADIRRTDQEYRDVDAIARDAAS